MTKKKTTPKKKPGFKAPMNTKTGEAGAKAVSTKPKAKDAAENPKAVTGDNILTDDQHRLVFFNHMELFKKGTAGVTRAAVEKRAADAELKKVKKLIQSEGTALTDIETALRLEEGEEKAMKAEIENRIKIARWLNIPMGRQFSFDDVDRMPAVDKAFEEGKIAGLKATTRKPPYDTSVPQHQRWLEGYAEGQAVHSKKFKPLEKTDVPVGSKPKTEAAGEKPASAAAGDKAGGTPPSATGAPAASSTAAAGQAATPTTPKTPPTPPEGDNVVNLQTGGKKTA